MEENDREPIMVLNLLIVNLLIINFFNIVLVKVLLDIELVQDVLNKMVLRRG